RSTAPRPAHIARASRHSAHANALTASQPGPTTGRASPPGDFPTIEGREQGDSSRADLLAATIVGVAGPRHLPGRPRRRSATPPSTRTPRRPAPWPAGVVAGRSADRDLRRTCNVDAGARFAAGSRTATVEGWDKFAVRRHWPEAFGVQLPPPSDGVAYIFLTGDQLDTGRETVIARRRAAPTRPPSSSGKTAASSESRSSTPASDSTRTFSTKPRTSRATSSRLRHWQRGADIERPSDAAAD
ncbi:MAG: hypothetical protein QOJ37_813, partial [Pseudonocardiales bacterium]|nr:hypothetical protein [Pseudonocardiales bacterium]